VLPKAPLFQADDREVRRRLRRHHREDGDSEPLRRVGRAAQAEPGALDQEEVGTLLPAQAMASRITITPAWSGQRSPE